MREIVLDTETTGFEPEAGHRIVEIGALELINHVPTGKQFHEYFNPERDMPEDAYRVHGLSDDFLRDKPLFAEKVEAFLGFAGTAPIVAHNAEFDMKFLNAELVRVGQEAFPPERAIDTLAIARRRYPGASNSLDALCRRFGVDNSGRDLHGALIDADLLAHVYLELIGGRQPGLVLDDEEESFPLGEGGRVYNRPQRSKPLPSRLSAEDRAAHEAFLKTLPVDEPLWLSLSRD